MATSSASSVAGATINHNNNNFSNITVTGATTIAGWVSTDGATYGLVFDATNDFILNSVDVFLNTTTAGNVVLALQNSGGTQLQTITVAVPAGDATTLVKHTINLGWLVPTGIGLRLVAVSGPSMVRESGLGGYPYSLGTSGTVTSGFITNPGSAAYYFFYNWSTTAVCVAPRLAVTAPPALTISSSAVTTYVDIAFKLNHKVLTFNSFGVGKPFLHFP